MAFQRPFLISLKRADSSQKWGFSIKGGKEYCEPLVIQTVAEDSLAEICGLHQGDEIIQVGRVNVQDLSLGQVYELLARCGNKIEMFVVREDLFSPRKGKEPPVVKAVVHNPYNSPLSLYSTENIAETLAQQTEVLTEGHISAEEDEGPENLSFKEKSAVFKLLEEQATQEGGQKPITRGSPQHTSVNKPKVAPPPPPKPRPPSEEHIYNGYDTHQQYQDHQKTTKEVEYQTTRKVVSQYQYQQEQPAQYQQTSVYQVSSQPRSPGYQSPSVDQSSGFHSPSRFNQQHPGFQSTTTNQQLNQQHQYSPQANYQQSQQNYYQQYQTPVKSQPQYQPTYQNNYQQNSAYINQERDQRQQSSHQQQLNQSQNQQYNQHIVQQQKPQANQNQYQYQGNQYSQQSNQQQQKQQSSQQQQQRQQQATYKHFEEQHSPSAVSKAELKIRPAPPPRNSSVKFDNDKMTAVYKQQYEQHLQQQYEQQQQLLMNSMEDEDKPKAHIINGNIFEHNSTSGAPITYKAPPVAPPKPCWPPQSNPYDSRLHVRSSSPGGMDVSSVWPPKRSTATELPRTGFNPDAVRAGSGNGRRCVWPPQSDEQRSGRNTPQSPLTGRRIQWNPSPSPPLTRRTVFSSQSPVRRKDIQWPPASPTSNYDKENHVHFQSPRLSRKAQFDDYVKEHASINVPQTYRPPPGTQHVEFY